MVRLEADTVEGGIAVEVAIDGMGGDILAEALTIVDGIHGYIKEESSEMEQDWVATLKMLIMSWEIDPPNDSKSIS